MVATDMLGRVILFVGKVSPFERCRRQGQSWLGAVHNGVSSKGQETALRSTVAVQGRETATA